MAEGSGGAVDHGEKYKYTKCIFNGDMLRE